jgi:hypothetical protein
MASATESEKMPKCRLLFFLDEDGEENKYYPNECLQHSDTDLGGTLENVESDISNGNTMSL